MKRVLTLVVALVCAADVWARMGETAEEASARYGQPRHSRAGRYANTVVRDYEKGGIRISATFFADRSGKSVIGKMRYSLPPEMSRSNTVAEATFLQLLESNTAKRQWEKEGRRVTGQDYRREGATAATIGTSTLTVTLDEYATFEEAERKRLAAEQAERVNKSIKDF